SAGFSPALGFVHTGKMLSFVYDVADLYKTEITIPAAFHAAADDSANLERRVRLACRDRFSGTRLLARIIPDIKSVLLLDRRAAGDGEERYDEDGAAPGGLWDPEEGEVAGGRSHGIEGTDMGVADGGDGA
ncbi:type I-E CRISPR-associated endonuclease Cas1, partial [bacterium]|nr:type I-E CRISPR-associated endonuclease Cas1 [candidate division CSSED10-310 bacterium]